MRPFFRSVSVFVEVHDPAKRGLGGRRLLGQIESAALSKRQGLAGAHNSRLAAVRIDHSYLGRADQLIDANRRFARWWKTVIPRDKTPPFSRRTRRLRKSV